MSRVFFLGVCAVARKQSTHMQSETIQIHSHLRRAQLGPSKRPTQCIFSKFYKFMVTLKYESAHITRWYTYLRGWGDRVYTRTREIEIPDPRTCRTRRRNQFYFRGRIWNEKCPLHLYPYDPLMCNLKRQCWTQFRYGWFGATPWDKSVFGC